MEKNEVEEKSQIYHNCVQLSRETYVGIMEQPRGQARSDSKEDSALIVDAKFDESSLS